MTAYRERLEISGQFEAFQRARLAGDRGQMTQILKGSGFTPLEIESILWAKGDLGTPPATVDKPQAFRDAIFGRIGAGLISGLILGGIFVWGSTALAPSSRMGKRDMMRDFRSPQEAYYAPFLWGFALGFVGGLATGGLVAEPFRSKSDNARDDD